MNSLIVIVMSVLSAGALADYEFRMKDLGCDYTISSVVKSSLVSNTTSVLTEVHGTFRKVTTTTTSPSGEQYNTESLVRPDLSSRQGYALHVVYTSTTGCHEKEDAIQTMGGTTVYKHREETTFNGHQCYKYYDVPNNAIFADAEGYVWGSEQTNDNGEVSTITYNSYETNALLAGVFTISCDISSGCNSAATQTPNETVYKNACNGCSSGSELFVVAPPNLGCNIKILYETEDMRDSTKTQTTLYAHGTFLLQTTTSLSNWESISRVLTRPDQGTKKGYAATYTYDYGTGNCTETQTLLAKIMVDTFYFTHRDDEFYNGFSCYKYYNDTALTYYVDKSESLPRGLVVAGVSTTRYLYYDRSDINATTFVLSDAARTACGSKTGESINTTDYSAACGPIELPEYSTSPAAVTPGSSSSSSTVPTPLSAVVLFSLLFFVLLF